ncbi:hypothetical protein IEQ44_07815 [Nocardioides sp. Y6]|uniref:Lipoprotein n=1 Tax=Nocardioides malaquae TaxID=2773426 RepID=A0ABR9RTV5_9ACTN|nr:hypothetical protein [Nocardioides malaquae]MBE7324555.1 hypothetical protein [Nocardioides malaquae]
MRFLGLGVGLLLSAACLVGCAEKEEPEQPSAEEVFCEAFRDYYERSSTNDQKDDAEVVASMKAFAAEAAQLEIPESMSQEASTGLQTWIQLMAKVPDDATQADVAALSNDLTAEQVEQLDAYYLYSNARCLSASQNQE